MNVTLIDYGAGNVTSVQRALTRLGVNSSATQSPQEIAEASIILLPGVGHFAALARALDDLHLRATLQSAIARGVPFLGICLGLQLLYEASAEAPALAGLNIFQGAVTALPSSVKLPHMGWNRLERTAPSTLLRGVPEDAYFYFAHSYAAPASPAPSASSSVTAICTHGRSFVAVAEHHNVFGVQFHPEKSAAAGQRVLKNFLDAAA